MIRIERAAVAVALTAFFAFPLYLLSNAGGPPPGHSGGPFPGEQSCAIAGCHGTGALGGPGSVTLTINGGPAGDYRYTPGETAMIEVSVADPNQQRWGFQLTARKGNGCEGAGMFEAGEQQVSVSNGRRVGACGSNDLPVAQHSFPKSGAGGASYLVNWTPGAGDAGPVTLAAAGNAANGNGTNSGDMIYLTSVVIEPAEVVNPGPTPTISEGGAVLATQTPVISRGSPTAILSVFGSDFAPAGTQVLSPEVDDDDGDIRDRLANTCVEVNGRRSPIFAVTPNQVNFQADEEVGLGPAMVQVIRNCEDGEEERSNMMAIDFGAASPGFFNFVNNADGVNPIAATDASGTELIGPTGLFGGDPATRPARPGEFIVLYATGFGLTTPAFEAGEIPQNHPSGPTGEIDKAQMTVMIGEFMVLAEDIFYAGVAPCCAGLNQLVIRVPAAVPDGDHEVIVTINGVSAPAGPFISVETAP